MAVRLRQKLLAFLLRHAPGDGDDRPRTGFLAEYADLAEPRIQLFFRLLPHAARVDDDHIRIPLIVGGRVARRFEQARHPLGVVMVHLTAEGFDQVLHQAVSLADEVLSV